MEYKPLPIGIDNFEEIIQKDYYYVDKTELIQQILDSKAKVTLFTRPRRFGKSLNLSMLQYYFEKAENENTLFEGLHINTAGEKYSKHKNRYPVIMLNFKEGKQGDFATSVSMLKINISSQFSRHREILNLNVLTQKEKEKYESICNEEADYDTYVNSIQFLCSCLEKASGEKVIILIDEYDVPLENAHFRGFYQEMIDFIRGLLGAALKTNNSLNFAVLTGCLRISKESIFTGLNNLYINSIQSTQYGEFFGFIQKDIDKILSYYGKEALGETVKDWYNGYIFGNVEVYNPWSIINYMFNAVFEKIEHPKPFWSNTSSNSIVRDLIEQANSATQAELEELAVGGTIEKPIREDITYDDIYTSSNNLWNFLYFTGYLRKVSERFEEPEIFVTLKLPNIEVASIYINTMLEWSREAILKKVKEQKTSPLIDATLTGDTKTMEKEINALLMGTISYFDAKESFYHGLVLGMYNSIKEYTVVSNIELGNGRADLVIMHPHPAKRAFIFEFKVCRTYKEMEKAALKALSQIEERKYKEGLTKRYGHEDIVCYGVAFFRKICLIIMKI